jgi:hypothetical protein
MNTLKMILAWGRAMSRKKQTANSSPPEAADDHDRKLLTDVERRGWHVIGVEEDEEGSAGRREESEEE